MIIDRSDMLELTRRMTPSRNCFGSIDGINIYHKNAASNELTKVLF